MRLGNLDYIEQEDDRHALMFKVDRDGDEGSVVGRRPCVGREAQRSPILLQQVRPPLACSNTRIVSQLTHLQHSRNPAARAHEQGHAQAHG